MELCEGRGSWGLGTGFAPESGGHGAGCPGQWSWHQADGVQEAFGQHSEKQGLNFGWCCVEWGVELNP